MTYLTPEDSIRRWTSAIWAETEGDAVPIWLYLVRLVALGIFFFSGRDWGCGETDRDEAEVCDAVGGGRDGGHFGGSKVVGQRWFMRVKWWKLEDWRKGKWQVVESGVEWSGVSDGVGRIDRSIV